MLNMLQGIYYILKENIFIKNFAYVVKFYAMCVCL